MRKRAPRLGDRRPPNVLSCLFIPRVMKHLTTILLAAASFLHAQAPGPIALRGARIVTVSGPVLEKGTVLLRNGLSRPSAKTSTYRKTPGWWMPRVSPFIRA